MNNVKISVITVCYNDKKNLVKTLKKILDQDFLDFECVVVDGGSVDGSREILQKYKKLFEYKGISFKFTCEKDKGIYDAMNKGVKNCSGDWVVFMNAGDVFFNDSVLKNVNSECKKNAEIIYGDNISIYRNLKREAKSSSKLNFKFGMPFCHQSAYIKRKLLMDHPYNIEYKICADYDFFVTMYLEHKSFKYIDKNLSVFEENGISSKNTLKTFKETLNISYNSGLINKKEFIIYIFKTFVASFIPKGILMKKIHAKKLGWNRISNI